MNKVLFFLVGVFAITLCACQNATKSITDSAKAKNLGLSGYVAYGAVEANNSQTMTPDAKGVIGRVDYKSRVVGIDASSKTPNTGFFKATHSKTFFGGEETIIEYDWTAGSDADATKAEETMKKMKEEAEEAFENESADSKKDVSEDENE